MKKQIEKPIDKLNHIKHLMMAGKITYTEAKAMAIKPITEINLQAERIAKKFKRTHRAFTFSALMR